jgi:hypothetical protein
VARLSRAASPYSRTRPLQCHPAVSASPKHARAPTARFPARISILRVPSLPLRPPAARAHWAVEHILTGKVCRFQHTTKPAKQQELVVLSLVVSCLRRSPAGTASGLGFIVTVSHPRCGESLSSSARARYFELENRPRDEGPPGRFTRRCRRTRSALRDDCGRGANPVGCLQEHRSAVGHVIQKGRALVAH